MVNMTPQLFIEKLQNYWNLKYNNFMADEIKIKIRKYTSWSLETLCDEIINKYKYKTLPALANVNDIIQNGNMKLECEKGNYKHTTMWQCGQCGKRYDYEYGQCPGCGKSTNALPDVCYCGDYAHQTIGAKFETPQQSKCPECRCPRETGRVVKGG